MSDRIRIADLRAKTIVGPSEWSTTRFAPFVELTPEERDALVEAVETLKQTHDDFDCGCDRPGNPAACIADYAPLLARFDFGDAA